MLLPAALFPLQGRPTDPEYSPSRDETLAADVARAWGGLFREVLKRSREALQGSPANLVTEVTLYAPSLPQPPELAVAASLAQARSYFKSGLAWLEQAARIYVLDGYVTDHLPLLQSMSSLYRHLAEFEPDAESKCKLHKRRLDLLEEGLLNLSPGHFLELYQQLTHEVAGAYSAMVDLKLALLDARPAPQRADAVAKVNSLALKAIERYLRWIQSFHFGEKEKEQKEQRAKMKEKDEGKSAQPDPAPPQGPDNDIPEVSVDPDYQRDYLTALFCVAGLCTKVISNQPVFLTKALYHFKQVRVLATRWKTPNVEGEVEACRDMEQLLPVKIARFRV